ncbi:MAG: AAA family ATPase [Candidatus Paceibacterota bacterium]
MTQSEALDILKLGHNVFLTGPAGSGKTFVLNEYIKFLRENLVDVGITASTGIAATHMNGTTIHSWTGMGIKDVLTKADLAELKTRRYLKDRFARTQVLVIDEVSMLHHYRLDLIDEVCRYMKDSDEPFGGLQIILCGDFFQLPPVARFGEPTALFAYESEIWQKANLKICYLEEQHRQTDLAFLKVLNEIRKNNLSDDGLKHLMSRHVKNRKKEEVLIEPTLLHTHNIDVDTINQKELERLTGQQREFEMESRGRQPLVDLLKKSCLAPATLKLKVGAKVMFVKNNFEEGYVNGTLGIIVGFDHEGPIVQTVRGKNIHVKPANWMIEEEGKMKASIGQYPLRLAWAITVHKSQGMSLDAIEVDLSKSFEKGMGYVALSRVRSLDGLHLIGLNDTAVKVRDEVLVFDESLKKVSNKHLAEMLSLTNEEKKQKQKEFLQKISPARTASGKIKKIRISPTEETRKMLEAGMSLNEMANLRGVKTETILDHIEKLLADDPRLDFRHLENEISVAKFKKIYRAFNDIYGDNRELRLAPVMKVLGGEKSGLSFPELRLVRLFLKKRGM